jgi:hypothetical protein
VAHARLRGLREGEVVLVAGSGEGAPGDGRRAFARQDEVRRVDERGHRSVALLGAEPELRREEAFGVLAPRRQIDACIAALGEDD